MSIVRPSALDIMIYGKEEAQRIADRANQRALLDAARDAERASERARAESRKAAQAAAEAASAQRRETARVAAAAQATAEAIREADARAERRAAEEREQRRRLAPPSAALLRQHGLEGRAAEFPTVEAVEDHLAAERWARERAAAAEARRRAQRREDYLRQPIQPLEALLADLDPATGWHTGKAATDALAARSALLTEADLALTRPIPEPPAAWFATRRFAEAAAVACLTPLAVWWGGLWLVWPALIVTSLWWLGAEHKGTPQSTAPSGATWAVVLASALQRLVGGPDNGTAAALTALALLAGVASLHAAGHARQCRARVADQQAKADAREIRAAEAARVTELLALLEAIDARRHPTIQAVSFGYAEYLEDLYAVRPTVAERLYYLADRKTARGEVVYTIRQQAKARPAWPDLSDTERWRKLLITLADERMFAYDAWYKAERRRHPMPAPLPRETRENTIYHRFALEIMAQQPLPDYPPPGYEECGLEPVTSPPTPAPAPAAAEPGVGEGRGRLADIG